MPVHLTAVKCFSENGDMSIGKPLMRIFDWDISLLYRISDYSESCFKDERKRLLLGGGAGADP